MKLTEIKISDLPKRLQFEYSYRSPTQYGLPTKTNQDVEVYKIQQTKFVSGLTNHFHIIMENGKKAMVSINFYGEELKQNRNSLSIMHHQIDYQKAEILFQQ